MINAFSESHVCEYVKLDLHRYHLQARFDDIKKKLNEQVKSLHK